MRPSNRKLDELRPISMTPDFIPSATGSVLIECGNTRVICTATVEEQTARFLTGTGKGWLTAEYAMLPASTGTRKSRERDKVDSRSLEIQRLIGRSLRAIIDLEALGERTIFIDCDVITADGGTRTASISGAYVALALAVDKLVASGLLSASPLKGNVAAISVGIVEDELRLDLEYIEDSAADVDMNVVMTSTGELVEVQGTGEGRSFTEEEMHGLITLAKQGIAQIVEMQNAVIQNR